MVFVVIGLIAKILIKKRVKLCQKRIRIMLSVSIMKKTKLLFFVFILVLCSYNALAGVPTQPYTGSETGLIHYYKFDLSTLNDSITGTTLTTLGNTNTSGKFGSARLTSTSGTRPTSDYISGASCNGNKFMGTTPLTYETFIQPTTYGTNRASIMTLFTGFEVYLTIKNQVELDMGSNILYADVNLSNTSNWYFISVNINSTGAYIWKDGILINSSAKMNKTDGTQIVSDGQADTCDVVGGAQWIYGGTYNQVKVDNIAIFNYTKTDFTFPIVPIIYNISGNILFNGVNFNSSNVTLLNQFGTSIISTTFVNSTGGFNFTNINTNTTYLLLASSNNASINNFTKSVYVSTSNNTVTIQNIDFFTSVTSSSCVQNFGLAYFRPYSCSVFP